MSVEHHIRNPFEVMVEQVGRAVADTGRVLSRPRRRAAEIDLSVRHIRARDLWDALREGAEDLGAGRADILFLGLIYPLAGLVLARLAFSYDLAPLAFPLVSGFALVGPFAAIGLYEISRRREHGQPASWIDALNVLRSPAMPTILGLGAVLLGLFILWIAAAYQIFLMTLGPTPPASLGGLVREVFTTAPGWTMAIVGIGVGFLFAAAAFALSVVSFPLALDREVGVRQAMATSLRAVAANPGVLALWGAVIAGLLAVGSLPALAGLIFVVPLLGHASWKLYRKLIGDPQAGDWTMDKV